MMRSRYYLTMELGLVQGGGIICHFGFDGTAKWEIIHVR